MWVDQIKNEYFTVSSGSFWTSMDPWSASISARGRTSWLDHLRRPSRRSCRATNRSLRWHENFELLWNEMLCRARITSFSCRGWGLASSSAPAASGTPGDDDTMMMMMMMIQEEDAHSRLPLQDPAGLPRRDEQALWQALWRHSGAASKPGKGEIIFSFLMIEK